MTKKVTPFLNKINTKNKAVKIVRCGNAVENKTPKENCAKISKENNFYSTPPGTPQQNGLIELGFNIFYSWMHVMMAHVGIH